MPKPVLLATSLVGSYPQPEWLIDRQALAQSVPRITAEHLWRVPPQFRQSAQQDAIVLAVRDQESAGLDIITDGEQSRESYTNHFATALEGIDRQGWGETLHHTGRRMTVPRVIGPIKRSQPVGSDAVRFVRNNTSRMVKGTVPGPFNLSVQAQDDYYNDDEALADAYAAAVNAEIRDLFAAGADVVQLDEPWMVSFADKARRYGIKALDRAVTGVVGKTVVHICLGYAHVSKNKPRQYAFLPELEDSRVDQISIESAQANIDLAVLKELPSKTIVLGVLDLADHRVETPEAIATRIRTALRYVPPERLLIAPDCGMKYLPRDVAFRKLQAMVLGTQIVRNELTQ